MGRIRISAGDEAHEVPLAGTTILGRHPSCTWVLPQPEIPTFWVELRWTAAGWTWRELGGDARGPHRSAANLGQGWWLLDRGQRLNGRSVRVELLDDSPPHRFAVALDDDRVLEGEALHDLLADDTPQPSPAGWEQAPEPLAPLRDGDTFQVEGARYRFHEGTPPQATAQRQLDLLRHSVRLELSVEAGRPVLHVWDGPAERKARGAPLWALVPYFEARLADLPAGGWLGADEAHARWAELCPGAQSGPERVGQDRSRTCRALHALGVVHPHALFARRRVEGRWEVRIALEPGQLSMQLTVAD